MRLKFFLFYFLIVTFPGFSQDSLSVKIRDVDSSRFQKIKLYVNVNDATGKSVVNLDSSNFSITENESGKTSIPLVQNFFSSTEPMAILFAIDASVSMEGPPLNNVKSGLLKIVNGFRKDDKMGIAYFTDDFFKQASFDTDRDILRNNINNLRTGGARTELFKATIESIKWLKELPQPKRKILIVISDGDDNPRPESKKYTIEDVLTEIKNSEISVFSIGSTAKDIGGYLANMDKMAKSSLDGKYYKITKPEDISAVIPAIYERIKDEYVLMYFSNCKVNTNVNATLDLKMGDKSLSVPFKYLSPGIIVEHAPSVSFWKTKEFLYGSIGAGVIIVALAIFMFLNMSKKKQYRHEKEEERKLREEEAELNKERFEKFKQEYDALLDRLENQMTISQVDKDKIAALETQIESAGRTLFGEAPKLDTRRRTMILERSSAPASSYISHESAFPMLIIRSGQLNGQQFRVTKGETYLGRMDSDIILPDNTVSRSHARIFLKNQKFFIEDLNSTNGTFVNSYRVSTSPVNPGDIIKLGSVEILFKA